MSERNGTYRMDPDFIRAAAPNPLHEAKEQFLTTALKLATNAYASRLDWLRGSEPDQRRNIDDACGWPANVTPNDMQRFIERFDMAARVVELFPDETFAVPPTVYELERADKPTEFESAWDAVCNNLRGESFHADEEGSPMINAFHRFDIVRRYGRYGVLVLGFADGKPLGEPVAGFAEDGSAPKALAVNERGEPLPFAVDHSLPPHRMKWNAKHVELLYVTPYPEAQAQVTRWETNPNSPRFAQPIEYLIQPVSPTDGGSFLGQPQGTFRVHWTRVIHSADGARVCPWIGTPACLPVWNRLCDARKVIGASAEGYWQSAFFNLSLESHPTLGGEVTINPTDIRAALENMFNSGERSLITAGMTAKTLAPSMVDPTVYLEVQIQLLCIALGCPIRIFKGSERGQLASSQDEMAWLRRMGVRQTRNVTPTIIVPLVDRLIKVGCLPQPKAKQPNGKPLGFKVHWPDLWSPSEAERMDVATKKVAAITTWASGGGTQLMADMDFWTRIMGQDEDESQAIIDGVEAQIEAEDEDAKAVADEHGFEPSPPPGFKTPEPVGEVANAFCPTGEGGGVDPSCSGAGSGGTAALYERAGKDPSLTWDEINAHAESLAKLPKVELIEAAKAVDAYLPGDSKTKMVEAISRSIKQRKGSMTRSQ